jgi:LysM domain
MACFGIFVVSFRLTSIAIAVVCGAVLAGCGSSRLSEAQQPVDVIEQYNSQDFVRMHRPVRQDLRSSAEAMPSSLVVRVVEGESLYGLALRFNTTVDKIVQANGLRTYVIYAGQTLFIPTD